MFCIDYVEMTVQIYWVNFKIMKLIPPVFFLFVLMCLLENIK